MLSNSPPLAVVESASMICSSPDSHRWPQTNKRETINLCGSGNKQQVAVAVAATGMAFWGKLSPATDMHGNAHSTFSLACHVDPTHLLINMPCRSHCHTSLPDASKGRTSHWRAMPMMLPHNIFQRCCCAALSTFCWHDTTSTPCPQCCTHHSLVKSP